MRPCGVRETRETGPQLVWTRGILLRARAHAWRTRSARVDRRMKAFLTSLGALIGATTIAAAEPTVTVTPTKILPGDPVLVTVTDATQTPHGKAGGQRLVFFHA